MTVTISLPPYLRDWLVNETGGHVPVRFQKNSPFNAFLRSFCRHKNSRDTPDESPNTGSVQVDIFLPSFSGQPSEYFNYLPAKAAVALVNMIRDSFDCDLYRETHAYCNIGRQRKDIILAWMELHGIEEDDRNTNAILKREQIIRTRTRDRQRKRKKSN